MFPIPSYYFREVGGAMSHSWEGSFRQFAHTGPRGSNENTHRNYQENEKITGGIIVLFSFAVIFYFFWFFDFSSWHTLLYRLMKHRKEF